MEAAKSSWESMPVSSKVRSVSRHAKSICNASPMASTASVPDVLLTQIEASLNGGTSIPTYLIANRVQQYGALGFDAIIDVIPRNKGSIF